MKIERPELVNRSYPYKKLAKNYFYETYGKGNRNASKSRNNIYYSVTSFGEYLENHNIPVPTKADLIIYIYTLRGFSIDDIGEYIPPVIKFMKWLEKNIETIFDGIFKNTLISREIDFNKVLVIRDEFKAIQDDYKADARCLIDYGWRI